MYCPKCSQHIPEDRKFCSRCGLSISEVQEWLERGGGLALQDRPGALSPRRKGMRRGAKTMFWAGVLSPLFIGMSIAADSPGPLFIPFLVFLAGLSILLYSRLFREEISSKRSKQAQDMSLGTGPAQSALPPASDAAFISGARREVRTAEMVQPPSVTDHTTKLLDDRQKLERE